MTAPRFICRTDLAGLVPLVFGGSPVVEQYARLRETIATRLGDEAAMLFAEPVVTKGNGETLGSISWYTTLAGEPRPLPSLALEGRAEAEGRLRTALVAVASLRDDPTVGPLIERCLVLPTLSDVLVLDGGIILVGWGLAPSGVARDEDAIEKHAASVLGAFLPARGPAPSDPAAQVPSPEAESPATRASAPPDPFAAAAATTHAASVGRDVRSHVPPSTATLGGFGRGAWFGRWYVVSGLVLGALAFLALGFWLGWTLLAARMGNYAGVARIGDEAAIRESIRIQQQTNDALAQEVARAQQALKQNVCTTSNPLGLPPAPDATPIEKGSLPPPASGAHAFEGNLLQLLDEATVLVLGLTKDGKAAMGSGFFVTPTEIVTNAHVAGAMEPGKLFVASTKLGGIRPGRVIAATADPGAGQGNDFALIELSNPPPIQPLGLSTAVDRLEDVVAGGFPYIVLEEDAAFQKLLHGDIHSIPDMVVTSGLVSVVQSTAGGLKVIAHTATIAPGNSGGPLVDRCGRLLGVNTFGRISATEALKVNYAISTANLISFLKAHNVPFAQIDGACAPAEPAQHAQKPTADNPQPTSGNAK